MLPGRQGIERGVTLWDEFEHCLYRPARSGEGVLQKRSLFGVAMWLSGILEDFFMWNKVART